MNNDKTCVLAALGLSDDFRAVAERARTLARCVGTRVHFVHVVDDAALFDYSNEFNLSGMIAGEYEAAELDDAERARKIIEEGLQLTDEQRGELEVLIGPRAETIEARARKLGASMVVVGQPETRFGSVATHLARTAPCDIHIVRTGTS